MIKFVRFPFSLSHFFSYIHPLSYSRKIGVLVSFWMTWTWRCVYLYFCVCYRRLLRKHSFQNYNFFMQKKWNKNINRGAHSFATWYCTLYIKQTKTIIYFISYYILLYHQMNEWIVVSPDCCSVAMQFAFATYLCS